MLQYRTDLAMEAHELLCARSRAQTLSGVPQEHDSLPLTPDSFQDSIIARLAEIIEIIIAGILVTIQLCDSCRVSGVVDQIEIRDSQRNQIVPDLRIKEIVIILCAGILDVRLPVASP